MKPVKDFAFLASCLRCRLARAGCGCCRAEVWWEGFSHSVSHLHLGRCVCEYRHGAPSQVHWSRVWQEAQTNGLTLPSRSCSFRSSVALIPDGLLLGGNSGIFLFQRQYIEVGKNRLTITIIIINKIINKWMIIQG